MSHNETEIAQEKAINFIRDNAEAFARAKAKRKHLEQFRKTKKALLKRASKESSDAKREDEAYAHPEYQQVLKEIEENEFTENKTGWLMKAAELRFEMYRTITVNARKEQKRYGA